MSYNENLNYNEEIWKPVYLEKFKHLYEVSNKGNVRRIGGKILKLNRAGRGGQKNYLGVKLCNNKLKKDVLVHRLVKITFDPIENHSDFDVHHRDDIKHNNNLYNLQYLSKKDHAVLGFKKGINKIGKIGKNSLSFKGLTGQFNKQGHLVNIFEGKYDLKSNGYNPTTVYKVINNNKESYRGFLWKRFPKENTPIIGNQYDMEDPMWEKTISKKKLKKMIQMAFKF